MTKIVTISIQFFLLASSIFGQPSDVSHQDVYRAQKVNDWTGSSFETLLYADPAFDQQSEDVIKKEFTILLSKIGEKTTADSLRFLYQLYSYIQRKELRHYQNQSSFHQTLLTNRYDCLTSSLLIGLVLQEFDIPFKVMEFEYHIAILVHTEGKQIMLDPADPISGYVESDKEIAERVAYYLSDEFNQLDDTYTPLNTTPQLRLINMQELIGLHFFNLAVDYYNNHRLVQAQNLAEKAYQMYPSDRHQQLLILIQQQKILAAY